MFPIIKNRKEFFISDKENGYTVITYNVVLQDTFPSPNTEVE